MKTEAYFPLFVNLSEKKIVMAGGGDVAERRVKTLLDFAGSILVVAPECTKALRQLADKGRITIKPRPFLAADIQDADIVLAATDDCAVNDWIYLLCKEKGIPVNVASDKRKCDFYFPGIVKRDEVVVGITACGANHKKARQVREAIENGWKQITGEERNGK